MSALDRLDRWCRPVAPPERLALLRILIGLFGTVYVGARIVHFSRFTRFSPAQFRPLGVVSFLAEPLPSSATWALSIATVLAGAAFVTGYRYRYSGPIFAALLWWVLTYASSWGMIFHTENLLCLQVAALALAPAADALSLDARGRHTPDPSRDHGWAIRLCAAIVVFAYFIAGLAKLRHAGLAWMTSDILRNYVAYDAVRKAELGSLYSPLAGFLARYPKVFEGLAWLTMGVELGAPLALVSRRAGRIWVAAAFAFHTGVLVTMVILFAYPQFGFAFLPFFRVERAWARIKRWRAA